MTTPMLEGRSVVCSGTDADGHPCSNPTTSPSRRCPEHEMRPGFAGRFRRTPTSPIHRSYRWRRLAHRFRQDWVNVYGWLCDGFRRDPHPASTLAVDHIVPVSIDPSRAYDWANLRCLCPSCNARKSLSERRR